MASVTLYLRGRLVEARGYLEPYEHSTCAAECAFIAEDIKVLDDGPMMGHTATDEGGFECIEESLSSGEWRAINEAFFDSRPFSDYEHMVFTWTETEQFFNEAADALSRDSGDA